MDIYYKIIKTEKKKKYENGEQYFGDFIKMEKEY